MRSLFLKLTDSRTAAFFGSWQFRSMLFHATSGRGSARQLSAGGGEQARRQQAAALLRSPSPGSGGGDIDQAVSAKRTAAPGVRVVAALLLALAAAALMGETTKERIYFEDVAVAAGLKTPIIYGGETQQKYILETTGTGVAIFDYDADGLPDIFLVNGRRLEDAAGPQPSNLLYRNLGNSVFSDVTESAGLSGSGWGQAVCVGDIDNDGTTDLLVTYYGANALYRNRGNGKFEDVSQSSGVQHANRWNSGCAFWDYDRDGDLDLFIANYVGFGDAKRFEPGSAANCRWKGMPVMCGPMGLQPGQNALYRNDGKGAFTEVSQTAGIGKAANCYGFMPVTLDYDQDGWPDLFVTCDSTPNLLFHNRRDGTFEEIGLEAGVAVNEDGKEQASMGAAAGDYDADGLLDLFVTNFSEDTPTLYRAGKDGTFVDMTYQAKLGLNTQFLSWGASFADFDADGWKDLLIVSGHVYPEVDRHPSETRYRQPRLVYRNRGNGAFVDISSQAGPAVQAKKASRGLAVEDLDGDGRLEAVVANLNDVPSLLKNRGGGEQNWLTLRLQGVRSNRSAIGARVQLVAAGRVQTDEIRSSSSFYSSSGLRLHFGLGSQRQAERIEVFWPSGSHQTFEHVNGNRVVTIDEAQGLR